jgi:hypothetical protein
MFFILNLAGKSKSRLNVEDWVQTTTTITKQVFFMDLEDLQMLKLAYDEGNKP